MTDAERFLWYYLRNRRLDGFRFRRQFVIEPYIVDFICLGARVIVECDGGQHAELEQEDAIRDHFLQCRGYRVLRFWNSEVFSNMEGVCAEIVRVCRICSQSDFPPS